LSNIYIYIYIYIYNIKYLKFYGSIFNDNKRRERNNSFYESCLTISDGFSFRLSPLATRSVRLWWSTRLKSIQRDTDRAWTSHPYGRFAITHSCTSMLRFICLVPDRVLYLIRFYTITKYIVFNYII